MIVDIVKFLLHIHVSLDLIEKVNRQYTIQIMFMNKLHNYLVNIRLYRLLPKSIPCEMFALMKDICVSKIAYHMIGG